MLKKQNEQDEQNEQNERNNSLETEWLHFLKIQSNCSIIGLETQLKSALFHDINSKDVISKENSLPVNMARISLQLFSTFPSFFIVIFNVIRSIMNHN